LDLEYERKRARIRVMQRFAAIALALAKEEKVVQLFCSQCDRPVTLGCDSGTLDIHHVNGDGPEERARSKDTFAYYEALFKTFFREIVEKNVKGTAAGKQCKWTDEAKWYKARYRLLCRKCHQLEHGACPAKEEEEENGD